MNSTISRVWRAVAVAAVSVFSAGALIALAGGADVRGPYLTPNSVATVHIQSGAVDTDKLAGGAVTSGKVGDGEITTPKIGSGAVDSTKLHADAVNNVHVLDGAITTGKLGGGAVTSGKLHPDAVTAVAILNAAVTEGKLADGAVTTGKIGSGAIDTTKMKIDAVASQHILNGSVTTDKVGAGAIDTGKVLPDAISSAKLLSDEGSLLKVSGGAARASGGNIGINQPSPAQKLDVVGDSVFGQSAANGTIQTTRTGANASDLRMIASSDEGIVGTFSSDPLRLYTNTLERMTVLASGEVGLGTATPASLLHLKSVTPWLTLQDSDEAADERLWQFITTGGKLRIRAPSDDLLSAGNIMEFQRNGNIGISSTSPAGTLTIGGAGSTGVGSPLLWLGPTGTGDKLLVRLGEPGFDGFGLNLRASNLTGVYGFYALSAGVQGTSPILAIDRSNAGVGIGTDDPTTGILRVASAFAKTDTSSRNVAFFGSSEPVTGFPFGVNVAVVGAAAIANRYVKFESTDYNLIAGGNLVFQPISGNVGLGGTTTPAEDLDIGNTASATDSTMQFLTGATKKSYICLGSNGAACNTYIGIAGAADDLVTGTIAGTGIIRASAKLLISADGGVSAAMVFDGAGANARLNVPLNSVSSVTIRAQGDVFEIARVVNGEDVAAVITGFSNSRRLIKWRTDTGSGGTDRWAMGPNDTQGEPGGTAGSKFSLINYDTGGTTPREVLRWHRQGEGLGIYDTFTLFGASATLANTGVVGLALRRTNSPDGAGCVDFQGNDNISDAALCLNSLTMNRLELQHSGSLIMSMATTDAALTVPLTISGSSMTVVGPLLVTGGATGSGVLISGFASGVEPFRIGNSTLVVTGGNVGIGITAPGNKLHIEADTAGAFLTYLKATSAAGNANGLQVDAGTNSSDDSLLINDKTGGSVYLNVRGDGLVGIGTASPSEVLTVNGKILYGSAGRFSCSGTSCRATVNTGGNGEFNLVNESGGGFKVGISTGSPQATLDVNGDAAFGSSATRSTFTATGLLDLNAGGGGGIRVSSGPTTGATVSGILSATASLDFGAVGGASCSDLTMTVTGAGDGDIVTLGVPNALASTTGLQFSGFVSAGNTVTVRTCCNNGETAGVANACADPSAATVRATVVKH